MTTNKQDPLIESLMGLAVAAAPLIRRAREAGMFRSDPFAEKASGETVDVSAVKPAEPPATSPEPSAEVAALQSLLVRQAMRIAELEAEVAALKAKPSPAKKPAAKKKPAKG